MLGIAVYIFSGSMYSKFEPTVFENSSFRRPEVTKIESFNENLRVVLEYNNVKYKIDKDGDIMIKQKLLRDKELISNFTKKAMDTVWIRSHRK